MLAYALSWIDRGDQMPLWADAGSGCSGSDGSQVMVGVVVVVLFLGCRISRTKCAILYVLAVKEL